MLGANAVPVVIPIGKENYLKGVIDLITMQAIVYDDDKGEYSIEIRVDQQDEMGQLAMAVNRMGFKIDEKQKALNRQKDEYQNLFEQVPCIITVQDRDYKILQYNREFSKRFNPDRKD